MLFLSQEHQRMLNSSFILILLLGFLSSCTNRPDQIIKIGLVDSFFCLHDIKYGQITVAKAFGANSTDDGIAKSTKCLKLKKYQRRLHGHLVLKKVLDEIDHKRKHSQKVYIYPINVFEKNGQQSMANWNKALAYIRKNNIGYLVTASGHLSETNEQIMPKSLLKDLIVLAASGNRIYPVTEKTFIWPQHHTDDSAGLLFGHYLKPSYAPKDDKEYGYVDQTLKYFDKVSYLTINAKEGMLKMSSYALAKYTAHLINHCSKELDSRSLKDIRACLKRTTKGLTLLNVKEKRDFKTLK